ncbi:hypothetical protein OFN34_33175, partial [Escherichia coli]|nr:hypothetical protein [Escherichia coli]
TSKHFVPLLLAFCPYIVGKTHPFGLIRNKAKKSTLFFTSPFFTILIWLAGNIENCSQPNPQAELSS